MEKMGRPGLNFDAWRNLALTDPARFEMLRRRLIDDTIARAPQHRQQRLRGLQWRVDQARKRAPNPMAACVSISKMMWDSLAGRHGLLESIRCVPVRKREKAKILSLRRH